MAEALYRKYRPQVFEDVVGQEPIERTLKNAIGQDKVSHAYLFTGPRGTGKTTTARLLAKALLCEKGPTPDPDGTCEDCELIAEGTHPDVYELDAASRTGVENVREEIISRVSFAPTRGRYKVYIIDEVHMLSTAAFNALLKTLEEPPSHVVFVLCTTDPQKVPETIHSRCQRFDFRRIAPEAMVSRLGAICIAEDVEFEGEALDLISHRAEGGLRNALTSLEQIIAFENGRVTLAGAERLLGSIDSNDMAEIIAYIGKRDIANCFRWTAEYVETGADLAQFVRDMAEHVRNLYVMALVGEDVELDVGETSRHELVGELQWFGADRLARLLGVLGDLSAELKTSSNPRLAFEIALTRMVRPDSDLTLESLAERVEALESGYSAVAHVLPGQPFGSGAPANDGYFDPGRDEVGDDLPDSGWEVSTGRDSAPWTSATQHASDPDMRAPQRQADERGVVGGADNLETGSAPASGAQAAAEPMMASGPQDSSKSGFDSAGNQAHQMQQGGSSADDKLAALANPAALQRIWQAALSALKKQKQSYGVLFMNTKAHYDSGRGMVKVVFPAESTFVFNTVQKPDVQDALAASLEKAVGAAVPFMFEQAGGETASGNVGQARMADSAPTQVTQRRESSRVASNNAAAETQRSIPSRGGASGASDSGSGEGFGAETSRQSAAQPAAAPAIAQPAAASDSRRAQPDSQPEYEQVPYEEVPYEELPYEQVPYEEFDAPASQAGAASSFAQANPTAASSPAADARAGGNGVASSPHMAEAQAEHDAATAPSPAEPNLTPEGALAEDPAGVEALLQAGFGGGVVFTEIDE